MNGTIWKYELVDEDLQLIEMPKNAKLLHVAVQNGKACLWAYVNPDNEKGYAQIYTFGTGQPNIDLDELQYLGTCVFMNGQLVFHYFGTEPKR